MIFGVGVLWISGLFPPVLLGLDFVEGLEFVDYGRGLIAWWDVARFALFALN